MADPQPEPPADPTQIAIGLADTPDGQRLAILAASGPVNVTLLLTADQAKQTAKQIADAAASMSSTGLAVASGAMKLR